MSPTPQQALAQAARDRAVSLSALSRMLGRNVSYLQQFVGRGSPRLLPERERRLLADFLGIDEAALGAEAESADEVAVPYLAIAAAAGAGRAVAAERVIRHESFPRALLRDAGVTPAAASLIDVAGESMAPLLLDGDRVLVDTADRRIPAGGAVFVIRRDEALAVKRVVAVRRGLEIRSDNARFATVAAAVRDVTIVGRVRLLLRAI